MARRRKNTMSDKEAQELLVNMFVVWPMEAVENLCKAIMWTGNKITSLASHIDNKKTNKKSNDKKVKKDIVYDELEEWQKDEVKKGNYDSYNFEEEELEEDDYYSEDD